MLSPLPKNPQQQGKDLLVDVRVTTNAGASVVSGWQGGYLAVRLSVVPEKGKANRLLIELIADYFKVAKSRVSLIAGATSRVKRLCILDYILE